MSRDMYICLSFCVHLFVCGHVDCFSILDVMNNAEISTVV